MGDGNVVNMEHAARPTFFVPFARGVPFTSDALVNASFLVGRL
jgi:hypothetical protein